LNLHFRRFFRQSPLRCAERNDHSFGINSLSTSCLVYSTFRCFVFPSPRRPQDCRMVQHCLFMPRPPLKRHYAPTFPPKAKTSQTVGIPFRWTGFSFFFCRFLSGGPSPSGVQVVTHSSPHDRPKREYFLQSNIAFEPVVLFLRVDNNHSKPSPAQAEDQRMARKPDLYFCTQRVSSRDPLIFGWRTVFPFPCECFF